MTSINPKTDYYTDSQSKKELAEQDKAHQTGEYKKQHKPQDSGYGIPTEHSDTTGQHHHQQHYMGKDSKDNTAYNTAYGTGGATGATGTGVGGRTTEPSTHQDESGIKKIINKLNPLHRSRSPSPTSRTHHTSDYNKGETKYGHGGGVPTGAATGAAAGAAGAGTGAAGVTGLRSYEKDEGYGKHSTSSDPLKSSAGNTHTYSNVPGQGVAPASQGYSEAYPSKGSRMVADPQTGLHDSYHARVVDDDDISQKHMSNPLKAGMVGAGAGAAGVGAGMMGSKMMSGSHHGKDTDQSAINRETTAMSSGQQMGGGNQGWSQVDPAGTTAGGAGGVNTGLERPLGRTHLHGLTGTKSGESPSRYLNDDEDDDLPRMTPVGMAGVGGAGTQHGTQQGRRCKECNRPYDDEYPGAKSTSSDPYDREGRSHYGKMSETTGQMGSGHLSGSGAGGDSGAASYGAGVPINRGMMRE